MLYITESFNKSNFASVPYDNYQQIPVNFTDNGTRCPAPEKIKIPQSMLRINDMLSKGQKITLYVKSKNADDGGIYAARWENLYLNVFGSNGNFLLWTLHFLTKLKEQ